MKEEEMLSTPSQSTKERNCYRYLLLRPKIAEAVNEGVTTQTRSMRLNGFRPSVAIPVLQLRVFKCLGFIAGNGFAKQLGN